MNIFEALKSALSGPPAAPMPAPPSAPVVAAPVFAAGDGEMIAQFERHANDLLDEAIRVHTAQMQKAMANFMRPVWMAPAGQNEFSALIKSYQLWIGYYGAFDETAKALSKAGRSDFEKRLKFVIEDSQKALETMKQTAAAAGVHAIGIAKIQSDMIKDTTQTILQMNTDREKAFERMNAAWRSGF